MDDENESDDDDDENENDECGRGRVARDDGDECAATPRRSSMRWRMSDDDDFIAVAMRRYALSASSCPLLFIISISPPPLVPSAYLSILVFHPSYS